MNEIQRNSSSSSDDLPNNSNCTSPKQANYHYFIVRCLSKKKTLKDIQYTSLDDLKKNAYQLYEKGGFNDSNAILTHLDDSNVEVLLTSVPDLPNKGDSKDLFIRFVHPVCTICSNPFGIVNKQLLFQCPRIKCGKQYCSSCVQAVQGSPAEHPFVCISCKKEVIPERNVLIDRCIIWKSMCQLYGAQSLLDLKEDSNRVSCHSLLQNIEFRLIHLRSRLDTLRSKTTREYSIHLTDEQLITDVNQLYSSLEDLVDEIKRTDQEMHRRGIIVSDCLEKYQHSMRHFDRLCNVLVKNIGKLQTVNDNPISNLSQACRQYTEDLYRMDDLDQLSSEQNIKAIDRILEDIDFRRKYLFPYVERIVSLLNDQLDQITLTETTLEDVQRRLKTMSIVEEELQYLRQCLQAIDGYTDDYDKLLRDDQFSDIPCSKFILLLEKMRVRTEELEILNSFPHTGQAMKAWQNDFGTDEEFKPKAMDLFKAIEHDLQNLFANHNWIYSLSYKIGVIGHGSVGKSALVMKLADIEEFSSMIAIGRSTFGYLQFDTLIYEDPRNGKVIPLCFIDIEGATDTDEFVSTGNYLELINKADCDMYIIVFDDFFNGHNRICQEHIQNNLKRQCVLVRSKADLIFNQYLKEARNQQYETTVSNDYNMKIALSKTRNHALRTFDDKRLSDTVYLTATVCENNLNGLSSADFDFNALKNKLVEMAITDLRVGRICKLAILASRAVINTCFRRGYVVSQTRYRWIAAGTSLVPFLDELPRYFGEEKIRQALGVHDRCRMKNFLHRTKNSFEEYLTKKQLTVPKQYLISGEFKYLKDREIDAEERPMRAVMNTHLTSTPLGQRALNIAGRSFVVLGVVGEVTNATTRILTQTTRVMAPTTVATLRVVSITGMVIGAVTTPIFAAWSFYSTGRSMNKELHSICDDLVIILQYFAMDRCDDYCQNIQRSGVQWIDDDSSSSDKVSISDIICFAKR